MSERFFRMIVWDAAALSSGGTLESAVLDLTSCEIEYLELTLTPESGNADVKIEAKFSTDGTTFNAYTDQDPITTSTATDYATYPNTTHHYLIPRHKYVMIQLTELASKATTVTGRLECSEVV